MKSIFLSASVPFNNRGTYYVKADAQLILNAVREFVLTFTPKYQIVFGGDPALTRIILSIFEDLGIDPANSIVLYQSSFFDGSYPEENRNFNNVIITNGNPGNHNESLLKMRRQMLSRKDLVGAVFIGGMEAVETEHQIFKYFHPNTEVMSVISPGGGALNLALDHGYATAEGLLDTDFELMFRNYLFRISEEQI
ncbi:SLOG domain-containing protein [Methylophilus luteus]|uniref:Uncharacterized protein n=1 Tax=Methylophilus luteus TaxID=640108 RepID=A0ABW3F631_9PROT